MHENISNPKKFAKIQIPVQLFGHSFTFTTILTVREKLRKKFLSLTASNKVLKQTFRRTVVINCQSEGKTTFYSLHKINQDMTGKSCSMYGCAKLRENITCKREYF